MPTALCVSDVHIMSPDCPRGQLFESFLRSLSATSGLTHLFLLGDIFDLWVARHQYFIDRYARIIDEIRRLKSEGVTIIYFEGNHDLHLRSFWGDELGLVVSEGPAYVTLGNIQLRLEHGDQTDPDDAGYRFLRSFLRTPTIHWLIRNLPGFLIAFIGERASAGSRKYTSQTKTIEPHVAIEKIRAHARKAYKEKPFDIIVTGHVHARDDYQTKTGERSFRSVNLGSWIDAPCYFRLDDKGQYLLELN